MTTLTQPCVGPDGLAVTTGNATSAPQFEQVGVSGAGAALTWSSAQTIHNRATSLRITQPGGVVATAYVGWDGTAFSPTPNAYAYCYLYLTAYPASGSFLRVIEFYIAGTVRAATVFVTSGGFLELDDKANTAIGTTTAKVPLNTWCRVEMSATAITGTTGTLASRLYSGPNLETQTPDTGGSLSVAAASIGGQIATVRYGSADSGTVLGTTAFRYLSDLAYSDTAMPALPQVGASTQRRQTCVGTLPGPVTQTSARSGDQWSYVFTSGTWTTLTHSMAAQVHNYSTTQFHHYSTGLVGAYTAWRSLPVTSTAFVQCLLYLPSNPPAAMRVASLYASGTFGAGLQIETDGRLSIVRSGQTVQQSTTNPVPLNQWVRVALSTTSPSSIWADLRGYLFTNPESLTPTESLFGSQVVVNGSFDEVGFGVLSTVNLGTTGVGNAWDMAIADAAYSDAAMPPLFTFGNIAPPALPTAVNLALDPSMQSGITGAQTTGSTKYTASYDTTIFHSGTQSALVTRTTTTLDTILASLNVTPTAIGNAVKVCAAPGQTMSFSLWMRCNVANWQSRLSIVWRDSTGAAIGASPNGPQTTGNPANTWVLVKFENVTPPANTTHVTVQGVSLTPSGNAVGGELTWCDDLMITPGPVVQAYGDGNTPGWVWSNGANRSVSVKGLRSLAQLNRIFDPGMEAGANGWGTLQGSSNLTLYTVGYDTTTFRSGTRSFTGTRTATTPSAVIVSAYYSPLGTTASQPLSVFVTPGEVISTGVWMRCDQANWRSQMQIYWRDAAGAAVGTPALSTVVDSRPANTWAWVTFENVTVPAGAAMALFLGAALLPVGQNTVGGERAWYDDAMIVSGAMVQPSWNPTTEQPPGGGAVWLTGVPGVGPACRPIGRFTQWDGTLEQPLTVAGVYDGATVQPASFANVSTVP